MAAVGQFRGSMTEVVFRFMGQEPGAIMLPQRVRSLAARRWMQRRSSCPVWYWWKKLLIAIQTANDPITGRRLPFGRAGGRQSHACRQAIEGVKLGWKKLRLWGGAGTPHSCKNRWVAPLLGPGTCPKSGLGMPPRHDPRRMALEIGHPFKSGLQSETEVNFHN